MQPVVIYEIGRYIETCGKFLLLQYMDQQPKTREVCRVYMGCKGSATLELVPERMAFCYLGDAYQKEMFLEAADWSVGEDGIKEFDCISFLKKHQIPYKLDYCYESTKKAEKYLTVSVCGYLGKNSLLDIHKYHSEGKNYDGSVWEKNRFWLEYYPKYGLLLDDSSDMSVSYYHDNYTTYKPMTKSQFVEVIEKVDQGEICTLQELKTCIPSEPYQRKYTCFKRMSLRRQENHACRDHSYNNEIKNALVLKSFIKEKVTLYLAFPVSENLLVPCRVKLTSKKRELAIPWLTDLHNTYLVYRDWEKDQYFFLPISFELDENGMPVFQPQEIIESLGLMTTVETKAECRKWRNNIGDCYQLISASEHGFIYGSSTRYSMATPNTYGSSVYLKDCRICGKKILYVKHIPLDSYDRNLLYWLPDEFEMLFRFDGDLTEERLQNSWEELFYLPGLLISTEVGDLLIDCHGRHRAGREVMKLLRDKKSGDEIIEKNCVIREEDVTNLDWKERADILITMLKEA